MSESIRERLVDPGHAFDHPVTAGVIAAIVFSLACFRAAVFIRWRTGRIPPDEYAATLSRWRSWVCITLGVVVPLILGRAWTMAAVAVLSLLCYHEYARMTGLFREKLISVVVVLGILVVTFAVFDHYDRLFFATASLTSGLIAITALLGDRPKGFLQRAALGLFGFLFLGYSLGYVGNFANQQDYRPILSLIFAGVVLSDTTSYLVGRIIKGPALLPSTSPAWTVSGTVGALVVTVPSIAVLGHFVFVDTSMDRYVNLIFLGVLVATLSQVGTLMLAAIKRDVGVGSTGGILPGYGGLLDRFDSLVLVPPAVFHFLSVVLGPQAGDQPERIITGNLPWMTGN